MMGYGWGMGLAGWMFVGLFWMVLLGLGAWAVVAVLPRTRSQQYGRCGPSRETPLEILDRRFASGELTIEQYQQARNELTTHTTGPASP